MRDYQAMSKHRDDKRYNRAKRNWLQVQKTTHLDSENISEIWGIIPESLQPVCREIIRAKSMDAACAIHNTDIRTLRNKLQPILRKGGYNL